MKKRMNYADLIMRNNSLLQKLVNDVFDIAQMESGNIQMAIEPCSVNALCKEAVNGMSSQANRRRRGNALSRSTASDLTINTDRKLMLSIARQLSVERLQVHCCMAKLSLIILWIPQPRTVTFSVTDTGIGIPAEKAEIIFNRFEKLNSFQQGTGLGLHVCKLIASNPTRKSETRHVLFQTVQDSFSSTP
jgi:signal transduction histidine kinase